MYMGQIIRRNIYLEESNIQTYVYKYFTIFGTISLYNMYILQINQQQYLQMSFYLS